MNRMITAHDLARLTIDLEVPQLLSAMMIRHRSLDDADIGILQRSFAAQNALESLISIACSFHVLSEHMGEDAGLIAPMIAQADILLDDYAPYWMKNAFPADEEWIHYVADDLESIGELLSVLSDACHPAHPALSQVCSILQQTAHEKSLHVDAISLPVRVNIAACDNIIPFPVERRLT